MAEHALRRIKLDSVHVLYVIPVDNPSSAVMPVDLGAYSARQAGKRWQTFFEPSEAILQGFSSIS